MAHSLNKDPHTLTRWLLQEQQKYPSATGDFTIILNSIQLAVKIISSAASKAGIYSLYGISGVQNINATGDVVKKLDSFSNDCMMNTLSFTGKVGIMVSEENEEPIEVPGGAPGARYVISFDPLDGSSNIDANVSVGTIFGIHRVPDADEEKTGDERQEQLMNAVLQKGEDLVVAGYAMYGDATVLVLTFGDVVNGFTLDPQLGEFILTHRNIRIPDEGSIYSVNEGNSLKWDNVIQEYVQRCKNPPIGKPKKARYVGSMVADVHRTILYGGIFLYPGEVPSDTERRAVDGKLRLLYEASPMGFIIEAAGGLATTGPGGQRIVAIQPTHIHQKVPVVMGSRADVQEVIDMYLASES